jgi:hypothetical protein
LQESPTQQVTTDVPTHHPSQTRNDSLVVISFELSLYITAVVMDSSLSTASRNVIATAIANVLELTTRKVTFRAQYNEYNMPDSNAFSLFVRLRIICANNDFPQTVSFNSTELFEYLSDILLESVASNEMTGFVRALARSTPAPELPFARVLQANISSYVDITASLDENEFKPADEVLGIVLILIFVTIMFVCVIGILAYKQLVKFLGERSAYEEHVLHMAVVAGSLRPISVSSSGGGQSSPSRSVASAFSPGPGMSPTSHPNDRWSFYSKNQVGGGSPQWQRVATTARQVVSSPPGSAVIAPPSWGVEETKTDPGLLAMELAMDDEEELMRINSML